VLREVLQPKANEPVTLVVRKADGQIEEATVTLVELERSDGSVVGFLGIAPSFDGRIRESPMAGVRDFGGAMKAGLTAIPQFLSPSSFVNLGSLLFEGGEQVAITSDEAAERPISMVGAVRIAGSEDVDWLGRVVILAFINVFVGLVNLLPLLPLDGGHAAVATYERFRSFFTDRPYQADVAKLLPITYGVVAILAFLFLSTIWLDITRPIG
jgi:membrane-associated protease RseP (regulator of RpoE activity)